MKIAITGYKGRIGRIMVRRGCTPLDCDVTDPKSIIKAITSVKPDVILHLAAKSNVNFCELKKNDRIVSGVNVRGSYNVFDAASSMGDIPVILMSTDHVFDGRSLFASYREKSKTNPINQYGLSKLCAESMALTFDNVKIVRTSHVFSMERGSAIHRILDLLKSNDIVNVTPEIVRSFMYIEHFVDALLYYVPLFPQAPKILHIAALDRVSWWEFVIALANRFHLNNLNVSPSKYNNLEAPRGKNLGLNVNIAQRLGIPLVGYKKGISKMWADSAIRELGYD